MCTVELDTLKDKLDEYVRLAAAGETVSITDHSRVVAEIVPPQRDENAFFERGIREGWLRPARNLNSELPPRHPMVPFDELMKELEQDREDQ